MLDLSPCLVLSTFPQSHLEPVKPLKSGMGMVKTSGSPGMSTCRQSNMDTIILTR